MDDKEAYEAKLQAQIDLWQAEIDKLKAKAMDAGADASLKLNEQLHQLLEYQKENQEKLEQLRQT
ncbi:MAG: hypothetical protein HKN08_12645, partial [Gammaproteobacteria bacterium]|nr:hypothetical protein [Gammaproteobacteria bacterium]